MPKKFLTGSGPTRGLKIGSGYLNNPVRTLLRDSDNVSGRYPTVHRLNRKGTEGVKPNIQFDDTHTVRYGTRISDDFELKNAEPKQHVQNVDGRKWVVAKNDIRIQKESYETEDPEEVTRGVLILRGTGDGQGRWIRTKNKVSKPTLFFTVIQGPYNTGADTTQHANIKLYQGTLTDNLAVQVSTTGAKGSWKTIKLKKEFISSAASSNLINDDGKLVMQPVDLVLNDVTSNGEIIGSTPTNQTVRRPMFNVRVDLHVFSAAGYSEPFYIRLIQESISNPNNPNWGIADIDIISRDQHVKYPYLDVGDAATLFHRNKKIATPNFINSITTTGSSLSNLSDNGTFPFDEQEHSAFLDNIAFEAKNNSFHTQGVSPSVTPGFSNTLFSKTFFDLEMKAAEVDFLQIGLVDDSPISVAESSSSFAIDTVDRGQMLMAYWNFKLNKWEKIGKPLLDNRGNAATKTDAEVRMRDVITGSCLGFGPIMPLSFGKTGTDQKLYDREVMDHYARPTSTFGFPSAAKYHATGSQTIKASQLGITKPMLLEKCIYDLNLDFVVPGDQGSSGVGSKNPTGRYAYNAYIHNTTNSLYEAIQRLKIYSPTFFILVQRPNNRSISDVKYGVDVINYNNQIGKSPLTPAITEELPKTVKLVSGSNADTVVYDTRELVTYGQYQLFVTASDTTVTLDAPPFGRQHDAFMSSSIRLDDLLTCGLTREAFDVVEVPDSKNTNVIKIKGKKMHVPVKITNKHDNVMRLMSFDGKGGSAANVGDFAFTVLANKHESREFLMDGANRAIVNGYTTLEKAGKTALFSSNRAATAFTVELDKNLEHISPYMIFPEDDLVFGVQFPVAWDLTKGPGGIGSAYPRDTDSNEMKIGDTKIRLIGSQIRDGSEFHEGLNQNLTTNAVHEVIGSEPVVDQFQIANKSELTGSFLDQYPNHISSFVNIFGSYIHISDNKMGQVSSNIALNNGVDPRVRVNPTFNNVSSLTTIGTSPTYTQINRFVNINDTSRIFNDARIVNAPGASALGLNKETRVGSYSSLQNYTTDGNAIRRGGSPKYYFNYRHFGHYSDLVRQGHDSKFVAPSIFTNQNDQVFTNPTGEIASGMAMNSIVQATDFDTAGFNLPPVRSRFVEQQITEDLNLKQFVLIKPSDVDGTNYRAFQSSNISPYSTSSLPFFDDGNVRNRTYALLEVLEVTV